MRRLQVGAAAVTATLAMLLPAGPASAAIACGETLNHDATLHADLHCTAGVDGITIGDAGVKLDLNGHTVSGPEGTNTAGVLAIGTDNVKVIDGHIRGFGNAVHAETLENLTLRGLNVKDAAGDSLSLGAVDGGSITNNVARSPGGLDNLDADNDSTELEVAGNRFFRGSLNFDVATDSIAIGNKIIESPTSGIHANTTTAIRLRDNRIVDAEGGGITLDANSGKTRVVENKVEASKQGGIVASSGAGPAKLLRNTVLDVNFNGFFVGLGADVILRKNVAKRANGGDGIHVEDDDTLIENNRVINNDQHGIESDSPNGSGNVAKRNGVHPQCMPASLCA
jgi:hypothetical protein